MRKLILLSAAAFLCSSVHAAEYKLDAEHTTVMFKIRHLVGHVTGQFDKFDGVITYDKGNPKVWKASATIDAASIDTKVTQRDNHLRSADFFDVAKFPTLTFVSTRVEKVKGDQAKLLGKLTIHGVTKTVVLDLTINGTDKDAGGNERAAFEATTRINRKDFDLTWNDVVESGGVLVGDDVDITIEAEGIKQK